MTIQRSGPTPSFYEYICNYILVPNTNPPSPQVQQLMGPGQQLSWIDIPRFQRGISWDAENVKELFQSNSILLGNVILAQFSRNAGQFPHLPNTQQNYLILIDGLQRLAVGTAILSLLHHEVLAPSPNRSGDSQYFTALSARVAPFSAFYLHNDTEFQTHPRQAIREQYSTLRRSLDDYFHDEFQGGNSATLAQQVLGTFLARQVALDIYFNFQRIELLNTFIGINTVRVDLGPTDLLRAYILERATSANWSETDIEDVENNFTEVFTSDQRPKQYLLPFVNAALKTLDRFGSRLLPSWNTGLTKVDVDNLLEFITTFEQSLPTNSFLKELEACGKLPISIVLAYYYIDCLHTSNQRPSFFSGGTNEDSDLHSFLIASYRLLLDGSIGRTGDYLERIIDGRLPITLQQLADTMSIDFLRTSLSSPPDPQWLETSLNRVDQKKAPRVFNAMLLPDRNNLGSAFAPLSFSRAVRDFHIDHLIPESLLNSMAPGGPEGQTLRNFAPLPSNQNRVAKATSCSSKLGQNGIYQAYLSGTTHPLHPYCQWLLNQHATVYMADLDAQIKLERNQQPDIGTQRIQYIRDQLLPRL